MAKYLIFTFNYFMIILRKFGAGEGSKGQQVFDSKHDLGGLFF